MKRFLAFVMSLSLVGCMTYDPYTGDKKVSNSTKGAGIGAVGGAVLGALVNKNDRRKGALVGATLGGATGAGVGVYMDRQESKLRQRLESTGVRVQRDGDNLRLIMPGNITFDSGQADIRSSFYSVLDSVAVVLNEFDKTAVRVSGHTDSTGSAQLNQTLSQQRADSVRSYLASRNVADGRIQSIGYGPSRPMGSNATAEGKQANRRVEIELVPIQQ